MTDKKKHPTSTPVTTDLEQRLAKVAHLRGSVAVRANIGASHYVERPQDLEADIVDLERQAAELAAHEADVKKRDEAAAAAKLKLAQKQEG